MGAPPVPAKNKQKFRELFKGTLILSGGYDAARAEKDLTDGRCNLIAVGRPILANPDLMARWQAGAALNAPDMNTFYTPGPQGYTDYPYLSKYSIAYPGRPLAAVLFQRARYARTIDYYCCGNIT
jgi:N-ethylmaleimide reductase